MADLNPMYRALRSRNHPLPQTAPIAARFEACRQLFERLCIVVRAVSDSTSSALVEDSYGSFLAWGNDVGASTRTLDHTLRKTAVLSEACLGLLKSIYTTIQDGIDRVQDRGAVSDEFEIERVVDEEEEVGKFPQEGQPSAPVPALAQHLNGLVDCLVKLIPNLCDPFPIDTYSVDSASTDADPDIDLAKVLFPTATRPLLERLGWANCRRRRHLKVLEEKRRPGMPFGGVHVRAMKRTKKSPGRDVAIDAFNFQKPSLKSKVVQTRQKPRAETRYIPPPSETGASSIQDSIFSSGPALTGYGTATSIAETDATKQLTVPKPPIPLDIGSTFLCPYCHDEIEVGDRVVSENDWEGHVFSDLEPYMCTFDDCERADKTFGSRDDWFRHELESHRIMRVWVCRSCVLEFSSAPEFEAHLKEKHDNIRGPSQIAMMILLCAKHSEKHLKEEACPLCGLRLDVDALKPHIANHLEQLALTSINGESTSDEDDSDEIASQRFDDNASEGRTKLEILNDFVEEQLNYVLPENQEPADKGLDETNLDFAGDSDEEDMTGDEAQSIKKDARKWKVSNYLNGQSRNPNGRPGNDQTVQSPRRQGLELRIQNPHTSSSSAAGLSPVRTAPHPREEDFVGRDGDLANLYKILSTPGRICTISGTGGIGKTATAVEYTYRYEQAYSYIFWTQAETRVGCADTFSLIAVALGLGSEGQDQKQLIELSREFLEKADKKWLLVFDNVDAWEEIEEYIPMNIAETRGSVLITSRVQDIGPDPIPVNYFRIILKEMTMEENRALLIQGMQSDLKHEKIRFHPEYKIAGEIASLAGLPLAIAHIAGYVKASGSSLAEFLELWNEWRRNSLSSRPADASSNATLETIWSIGLSDLGADALKLLKIMAFFDSDVIQRELLMNTHGAPSLAFLSSTQTMRCRKMIQDLTGRKLISHKRQDGRETFSVHRLLQHRLLQDLDEDIRDRDEIFSLAFELLRERLPKPSLDAPDSMKWAAFKEYLPHVLTLQRIYYDGLPMVTPFVRLAELFRDGGVHLWQRGLIYDGLRLLNSAEAILDRLACIEDQLRIDIHIATALLIQYFGISHRAESRDRFRKILQIREKLAAEAQPGALSKDEEMTTCNSLADYGNSLLQFNNYKEAEPIYHKCHAKYQGWGSEDEIHFEYAKFYHHMAFCRMYHHDFDEAIRLSSKAVELVSRQTGQPQLTLRYQFDLACIILQSGDIEESLAMQEKILRARISLQGNGKANYFTLQSYYAVGASYAHLRKWNEAESYFRTALFKAQERADKSFWPEAAVARTEFHLSYVLRKREEDGAEAEGLASKARSVLSRLLPFDPLDGVSIEDEIALFDHLQPVFGGRFVGTSLLKYVL